MADKNNVVRCRGPVGDETLPPVDAEDLVVVEYQGERAQPMKYEVFTDGAMTKLRFGLDSPQAQVPRAVADVLTGKTPEQYADDCICINGVIASGKIAGSRLTTEKWVVLEEGK